jgi:hypothetical protein
MRKTIVYILSTPYAGSHYLSLLLGSNSRAIHVGELSRLQKTHSETRARECTLNRGHILEGIGRENINEAYDLIFSRIDSTIEALVDASKRVSWAEQFQTDRSYDKKYIHLIRDPRALVRRYALRTHFRKLLRQRWRVFKAVPQSRPRILFLAEPYVWAYYWLVQNQEITRFIRQNQLEHVVVTYRDLARNPAVEVRRLMEWIGVIYEPAQLEYWNFDHIGTEKREYEWVKEKKVTFIDLRWQSELPMEMQKTISEDGLLTAYLSSLGLAFTADGLTRHPAESLAAVSSAPCCDTAAWCPFTKASGRRSLGESHVAL